MSNSIFFGAVEKSMCLQCEGSMIGLHYPGADPGGPGDLGPSIKKF